MPAQLLDTPTPPPAVTAVLINWNGLADTLECLDSLALVSYPTLSVTVVDNGSAVDPSERILNAYPRVRVLRASRNLGYTGGNNLGIRDAIRQGADYVLCLNNDTIVAPDFLNHLIDAVEADSTVGIATPAIYRYSNPEELITLGCEIAFDCSPPARHRGVRPTDPLKPFPVDFGEGCGLLLRRAVVEATTGFEESLFAYTEDADLCLRAKKLGWRCIVVPRSRIWHKIDNKPTGHHSPTALFYSFRNGWHLVRRHGTASERRSFHRSQPHVIIGGLRRYMRGMSSQAAAASRRRLHDEFVATLVGTLAGILGWSGDRTRWAVAEGVIRLAFSSSLAVLAAAARGGRQIASTISRSSGRRFARKW